MAAFASAYGTFLTVLPASPPEASSGQGSGGRSSSCWGDRYALGRSSSSSSPPAPWSAAGPCYPTSGSPPPQQQPPPLPVHYRCLLLLDGQAAGNGGGGGGGVVGVRLGWARGLLRVTAVLSESVQRLCQVAEGDIVTHVNGEAAQQLYQQQQQQEEEEDSPPVLLLRSSSASASAASAPRSPCGARRAVVELRLIRASTLAPRIAEKDSDAEAAAAAAPSAPAAAAYARLHAAAGPMLLYEAHARDTLGGIATRFQSTAQEIRADNREVFPPGEPHVSMIQPGLPLRIRSPAWLLGAGKGQGPGPGKGRLWSPPFTPERRLAGAARAGGAAAPASLSSCSVSPSGAEQGRVARRYHLVAAGQALEDVARRYNVGVMEIRRWNRGLFPVGEPRPALPGDRLLLFVPVWAKAEEEEEEEEEGRRRRGASGGKGSTPIAIAAVADAGSSSGAFSPE